MKEWRVGRGEKDQRFNKYLQRKLPDAPSSFLYKMLRKKNITLNGKKASGSELLLEGDLVTLFLSDETVAKFGGDIGGMAEAVSNETQDEALMEYRNAYRQIRSRIGADGILYEDENILAVRKPVGVLAQKSADTDRSMNEWFVGYLLEKGETDAAALREFRPSICNRLDRNTGGILLCAKTLPGARTVGSLLKERSLHKYYQAAVAGKVTDGGVIEGFLTKDAVTNTVNFSEKEAGNRGSVSGGPKGTGNRNRKEPADRKRSWTSTIYKPLITGSRYSLLEMELITGKTHQIRSHLASIGHPILGDPKYGNPKINEKIRAEYGVRGQMLWCCRVEFPKMEGDLAALSGRVIVCDPPALYREIAGRNRI